MHFAPGDMPVQPDTVPTHIVPSWVCRIDFTRFWLASPRIVYSVRLAAAQANQLRSAHPQTAAAIAVDRVHGQGGYVPRSIHAHKPALPAAAARCLSRPRCSPGILGQCPHKVVAQPLARAPGAKPAVAHTGPTLRLRSRSRNRRRATPSGRRRCSHAAREYSGGRRP